jgi:hypothetical protein
MRPGACQPCGSVLSWCRQADMLTFQSSLQSVLTEEGMEEYAQPTAFSGVTSRVVGCFGFREMTKRGYRMGGMMHTTRRKRHAALAAALSKPIARIAMLSMLYLAVFTFVLSSSFQYVYPGAPGSDTPSARRAERFGIFLNVLALPFFSLVCILPGVPNAFPGPASVLSIVANSFLWGYGVYLLCGALAKVYKRLREGRSG